MARVQASGTGEVLIRVGDSRNGDIDGNHIINGFNTTDEFDDSKERRRAMNEAYRRSSPSNYLKTEARKSLPSYNNTQNEIQANHVIYTKVSSAVVAKKTPGSSSNAVTTRNITSSKVSQSVFIPVNYNNVSEAQNRNVSHGTTSDDKADRLLKTSQQNSLKYQNEAPLEKDACFYCRKTVYTKEKIGPVRDVLYHKQCFRCAVCNFQLTLTNFCQNHRDDSDKRMYCKSHQPMPDSTRMDLQDTSIQAVINKPRMGPNNPYIRSGPDAIYRSLPADSLNIRGPMEAPKLEVYNSTVRPVPALAQVPSKGLQTDPDAYKSRQLTSTANPPSPPYHSERGGYTEDALYSYLLH